MADTTRRWPSVAEIAQRMRAHAEADPDFNTSPAMLNAIEAWVARFHNNQGFLIERKLARLTEKLKDAIEAEQFGPLFVDDDGNPIPKETVNDLTAPGVNATQAYQIWRAFRNIYSLDVLDNVDEEGELL